MLKVSTRSTYAVRALIHLCRFSNGEPVSLSVIAERQHIPLPYLEQIFSKLRKANLVEAVRGPQGGFKLIKDPSDIALGDIVSILEKPMQPVLCSLPENRTPDCHETGACMSSKLCHDLDGAIHQILKKNTLASLSGIQGAIA